MKPTRQVENLCKNGRVEAKNYCKVTQMQATKQKL